MTASSQRVSSAELSPSSAQVYAAKAVSSHSFWYFVFLLHISASAGTQQGARRGGGQTSTLAAAVGAKNVAAKI